MCLSFLSNCWFGRSADPGADWWVITTKIHTESERERDTHRPASGDGCSRYCKSDLRPRRVDVALYCCHSRHIPAIFLRSGVSGPQRGAASSCPSATSTKQYILSLSCKLEASNYYYYYNCSDTDQSYQSKQEFLINSLVSSFSNVTLSRLFLVVNDRKWRFLF